MAEETKTEIKAVEVTYDAEGNPEVKAIEEPQAEETKEDDKEEDLVVDSSEENEEVTNSDVDDNNNEEEDLVNDIESEAEQEAEEDLHVQENSEENNDEDVVDYDELPEAVQAYLDFYEETGGSMQDFALVNRDFDSLPQDDVIREFLRKSNPYLDTDDIEYEIETRFGISEADSDAEARQKKVAKKKFYGEAMKTLKAESEKYKADLGSSAALPAQAKEALRFQKEFQAQQVEAEKATAVKVDSFVKNTNKILGKDFKGFEVKVGEETLTYKPNDVRKTREENLNVNNLLNRFTDKDGNVTDVKGYHKALTFASNPDTIAAHFFELGRAAQIEEGVKDSKNIQMKPRQTQAGKSTSNQKFKFVDVNPNGSKNAKIKLRNY